MTSLFCMQQSHSGSQCRRNLEWGPRKTWIFPNFQATFLVLTLQQLHLSLWAALHSSFSVWSSFTPTYKVFHYHLGPISARDGHLYPMRPPVPGIQGGGVVCAGSGSNAFENVHVHFRVHCRGQWQCHRSGHFARGGYARGGDTVTDRGNDSVSASVTYFNVTCHTTTALPLSWLR